MLWSRKAKESRKELRQQARQAKKAEARQNVQETRLAKDVPRKAKRAAKAARPKVRKTAPALSAEAGLDLQEQRRHALKARQDKREKLRIARKTGALRDLEPTPLVEAMLVHPMPLIDPEHRLIVFFSPKAACTTVAIWFFNLIGHLKAARDYNEWPHDYRVKLFNHSNLRRRALKGDLSSYSVVRVVRDPYDRVTSSFRHAVLTGYADLALAAALPEFDPKHRSLSFSRFLDFLETEDLTRCNTHHALQMHPAEDLLPPGHVINISREDLFSRLNEVEAEIGLPRTDIAKLDWVHHHSKRRHVPKVAFEGEATTVPLTRDQAANGPWPDASALLTPAMRERIARLYAPDVARYGSPPEVPLVRRAG